MNGKEININAYPRIHLTLIAMNNQGYRINGGIGFAIDNPTINLNIKQSEKFILSDKRESSLDRNQISRLEAKINSLVELHKFKFNIKVKLTGDLPTHSGFGSGTIIRLGCIEALFKLNDYNYTNSELINIAGRGGTSGIGIRTYFNGGYVLDIGHKNHGQSLVPSSAAEINTIQSLVVSDGQMPFWKIGICFPKTPIKLSISEELFFKQKASITNQDVYQMLYHVIYGLFAGINENDKHTFSSAVKLIQDFSWKQSERNLYKDFIIKTEQILYNNGASAIGMSSLGPGLYFLSEDIENVINKSSHMMPDCYIIMASPINTGRILNFNHA